MKLQRGAYRPPVHDSVSLSSMVSRLPATKDTSGSNFLHLTVRVVRGRVVVLACLDNLVRGASGVAVQNFNRMYGFDERTALT